MAIIKKIKVKNINIGKGRPKIAVSITGLDVEEIYFQAKSIDLNLVDIIEWRADFYKDVSNLKKVLEVLKNLKQINKETPLIFTFRSKEEGGEKNINIDYYSLLNKTVASSKYVDLVDIQIGLDKKVVKETIKHIQTFKIPVIGSYHNFLLTPSRDEIVKLGLISDSLGVDIIKLAFMPKDKEDVVNLLYATNLIKNNTNKPIISMSMGKLGTISRITGNLFGSSVTFACMGKESAPGQIPVHQLYSLLDFLN